MITSYTEQMCKKFEIIKHKKTGSFDPVVGAADET